MQHSAEFRAAALTAIKVVHTIAWAFLVACILAIPLMSWQGNHTAAVWLVGIVFVEVAVLVINRWTCPLTSLAYRFTEARQPSFDIYLPEWLAQHNKRIFGTLFAIAVAFAAVNWVWGGRT